MFDLKKIGPSMYELARTGAMKVPGLVIANEKLLQDIELQRSLEQVCNVAQLPGIVGYSIAMPDIHWGYGFPIGGVAATDVETGVISPGGVGYDINCGVRLAVVPIAFESISESVKGKLLKAVFERIPSGVGREHAQGRPLSEQDYRDLIERGVQWSIDRGAGFLEDLQHTESYGRIEGGSIDAISLEAKKRGSRQMGSLGSGNHFVEIGSLDQIFLSEVASAWGLEKGQTYVLIHSGSRGFGHQICQDTLNDFLTKGFAENLPDKQLVAAPVRSPEGVRYFQAMAAAANFAFNNRQHILAGVRDAFFSVCKIDPQSIRLLYDVCHNIAKFETHTVFGKDQLLCVHRKGATRAFGPGAKDLPHMFQRTGQPVLVPGDMERASYVLAGLGNPLTWCSSCHGAGRCKSRIQSLKNWEKEDLAAYMRSSKIQVLAASQRTIAEEMPSAYKNIDDVVKAVEEAKLARIVARLKPALIIKG